MDVTASLYSQMLRSILDEEVTMEELRQMAVTRTPPLEAPAQLKLAVDDEVPAGREACPECQGTGEVQIKDDIYGVCPGCWDGGE